MKILNLPLCMALFSFMALQSMELVEEHAFIKTSISDILNMAHDINAETGHQFLMISKPEFFAGCLKTLGLEKKDTPLDARYHYDLLLQKLPENDPLRNSVNRSFNQLMHMLLIDDNYHKDIQDLMLMDSKKVETIELEDTVHRYKYLKYKNKEIDDNIGLLRKQQKQFLVKMHLASPSPIHAMLGLPKDASRNSVDRHYNDYMKHNSADKLIALHRINKLSRVRLKEQLNQTKRIEQAYEDYVK